MSGLGRSSHASHGSIRSTRGSSRGAATSGLHQEHRKLQAENETQKRLADLQNAALANLKQEAERASQRQLEILSNLAVERKNKEQLVTMFRAQMRQMSEVLGIQEDVSYGLVVLLKILI